MATVCGIDPGLKGGFAILTDGRLEVWPTPLLDQERDEMDPWTIGRTLRRRNIRLAVLEKVGARPGQGVVSMFRFGEGYGIWQGILATLGIPLMEVRPQEWKKHVLAGTARDKRAAVAWVTRNHPGVSLKATPRSRTPHDGMADAACLAEYARLHLMGIR